MPATIAIKAVEIAHLDLLYAHTRIQRPRQIVKMADSLMRHGQILPIVVVAGGPARFVLIDGYQRVEAARRAAIDTLDAQIWPGKPCEALCRLLASDGARQFDDFEQAALIRELKATHQLSQNRIAVAMGRHPSWVTRRLALVQALPAEAIEAVRAGRLSSWSASRVLVPLARANADHARALVDALGGQTLTSRQLMTFWQHYQRATVAVRKKMVDAPALFLESLAACHRPEKPAQAPEDRWLRQVRTVKHILLRLERSAGELFYPEQPRLEQRRLLTAFDEAHGAFDLLTRTIRSLVHAKSSRPTNRRQPEKGRPEHPPDRPPAQDVPKDRPAHPRRSGSRSGPTPQSLRAPGPVGP